MKITILGSLGNISKPLTQKLVANGHEVKVVSSDANKQTDIEAIGATAAIGSVEDVAFLTEAFTGADVLYVMVPPNLTVPDIPAYYERIGENYAKAIQQAGVKKMVSLSSMGAHVEKGTGPIMGARAVERILGKLDGVSVTFLRPAFFYTNFYGYVDMIRHMNMIGTNYGGTDRIIFVAPQDIAAAAADAIEHLSKGIHIRYVVSDEHTAEEAAAIIGAAIKRPELNWITFGDEAALKGMTENGMPLHAAEMFLQMGQSVRNKVLWQDYDRHSDEAFNGKIKLEDFSKEFAKAFEHSN